MPIIISSSLLKVPNSGSDYAETELDMPYGFQFTHLKGNSNPQLPELSTVEMYFLHNTEADKHSEKFRVTEMGCDLQKLHGKEPWGFKGMVEIEDSTGSRMLAIWSLMPARERQEHAQAMAVKEAQRRAILTQMGAPDPNAPLIQTARNIPKGIR